MTLQDHYDAYDLKSKAIIAEHGWMIQGVFGSGNTPGFAYTVGLTPAGLPELVMSGLDHNVMASILNSAAKRTLDTELRPGDVLDGVASVVFRVIAAPRAEVGMALRLYGVEQVTALQLVWPDKDGRYPGDPGWTLDDHQPLYGDLS